ncbi:polyprenyl synthetase family protein [Streptomyces nitrosporeus]|uniref:Polyprenyl synthetase family protein n=1 Tax=Streptomyces nitrosporeus TaxID=28894 RepID=A0A5J6FHH9_9ACTN|nr:polyprenyl synthetase family protein [Streptomyces nitrosporeus]QEU76049.1 polyprenyl synthetase family protein [Streptomyces nitrosporeus]GGZ07429.1 geranylgeranyl pyrophosphate synthase [Streptomyces nitrosporeus]
MSPQALTTGALDLAGIRERVDAALADFLRRPSSRVPPQNRRGHRHDLDRALTDYVLAPGKRIRPLLCVIGWQAAGGDGGEGEGEGEETVMRLAASLELFHAFALIHDDILDDSDTRRGLPSAHRAFAARHRGRPDADAFGRNLAVLLGDLALVRCDGILHTAGFTERQRHAVLPLIDTMRNEVVLGQYLDLHTAGSPTDDIDRALTVIRLKTARYTVERPLQLGAALAGGDAQTLHACSAYALPLGEAFQLRDDLLGTFGDPSVTGKPVTEDLRSGKATVLMALAVRLAAPRQAELLDRLVGNPRMDEEGAMAVRRVLEATGARATVEKMISDRYGMAVAALDRSPFSPHATEALRRIAAGAVVRTA